MVVPDSILYLLVAFISGVIGLLAYANAGKFEKKVDALKATVSSLATTVGGLIGHAWSGWGYLLVLAINHYWPALIFWMGWAFCFVVFLTNIITHRKAIR